LLLILIIPLSSCAKNQNIKEGTYISDGENPSKLFLRTNNEFAISGNDYVSLMPNGKYEIKDNKLFLFTSEDDVHIFLIENDVLIFESGVWLGYFIEYGSVFTFLSE